MEHPGGIQSVENAVEILDFIAEEGCATLTDLSKELELSKSTTYYYLSSLESLGILRNTNGDYQLGYKLLNYGGLIKSNDQLYMFAKPLMDKIAIETDLAVYLGVKDQEKIVHVTSISIGSTSIIGDQDGKRTEFHTAALGKAILAHLTEEQQKDIMKGIDFNKFTNNTITEKEELRSHLHTVLETGYAINDEEDFEGWKGIAVPILSEDDVEGAISVAGPKSKVDNQESYIIQLLKESKDEIELKFNVRE